MVVASAKLGLRMLFAATLVFIALLLFAGHAHADEAATTPAPETTTAVAPDNTATDPAPATSTPATDSTTAPADTGTTPPPTDTSTQAPAPQDQSAMPPTPPQAEPTPPTPAGAPGPTPPNNTNDQNADVGTTGTGVANTGGNAAGAQSNSGTQTSGTPGANNGSATAGTSSGDSSAVGTNSNSTIGQQAHAEATGLGTVDILQIALVVNIGVANSNTGSNVVGAGGAGTSGIGTIKSSIKSGNASALGNNSKTGIKQSAIIKNGEQSNQKAVVVNVGIALGNSGLNITIGTLGTDGLPASTQAVTTGASNGQIYTGDASAIGDRSNSAINQSANGTASGIATLVIDQRAVIVNFGTALANSGGNVALASFDPSNLTSEEAEIVYAVLSALAPLFGPPQTGVQNSLGGTTASIGTGNASAIGNSSATEIDQNVEGSVHGDGNASATQTAVVGNLGVALANTGFNGALAGVTLDGLTQAHPELVGAGDALTQFLALLTNLSWLDSANPFAQFAQSIDIGGVTLDLGGTLSGSEFLLGWDSAIAPDGGPLPGGVRVRQISGVLNIGFSTSDSGHNTVVAIVTGSNGSGGDVKSAKSATQVKSGSPDVLAQVFSGNALAIGNNAVVTVCQTFHDTVDCFTPKPTHHPTPHPKPAPAPRPHTPSEPPVVVVSANEELPPASPTAATTSGSEELPFTGSDPQALIAIAGTMLAAGAALSRRRRAERV